jgi:CheY-like chemotaxis protein
MFMARILVVEDEILIAWDLQSMLASAGFEVEIAHSVEMALRLIRSYRPDVAVLDGLLRSEAAAPVAKELESNGIPYLMCSAYNSRFCGASAGPWSVSSGCPISLPCSLWGRFWMARRRSVRHPYRGSPCTLNTGKFS